MLNEKIKHLELIQAVINRMATSSFLIKGWCVTVVAAIFALASKDANKRLIIVVYYPILMFWILDTVFLYQEHLFRKLYDQVRTSEEDFAFSMDTASVKSEVSWFEVFLSKTLLLFYVVMSFAALLSIVLVFNLF